MKNKNQSGVVIQSGGGTVDVSGSALAGEGGTASVVTHNAELADQFKALQDMIGQFASGRADSELQSLKDALAELKTAVEQKKVNEAEFQAKSTALCELARSIGMGAEAIGRIVKGLGGIARVLGWSLPLM